MDGLTLTTCQAPNMDGLSRGLAEYLQRRLNTPVRLRIDLPWQERERLLDAGEIDLGWICGLPYVRKADRAPGFVEPLAAPVMSAPRYGGQPVYFSDVAVRAGSPFRRLEDLRGAVWAYNEPGSHSGYGVVRWVLAERGESLAFFGRVVESGAHQHSLEMILRGEVDASALDSTVLEQELAARPELAEHLRVIDTFGPSPIPPWVVSRRVPEPVRLALAEAFSGLERDAGGQALLREYRIARFVPVTDADYNPIRRMARTAGL